MAGLSFNASTVEAKMGMDPVPQGTYRVAIVESEQREPEGKAPYLLIQMQILEGEHKGRNLRTILNLAHEKESVRKMAASELSCICHAVGVLNVQDSVELHNIPMMVDVVVTPPKDGYDAGNRIKKYSSISTTAPGAKAMASSPFAKK